ncbi:Clp protease ClpP, partial [Bifidobacterium adolescentis]
IQDAVAVAIANLKEPVTNKIEQESKQKSLIARLRKGE